MTYHGKVKHATPKINTKHVNGKAIPAKQPENIYFFEIAGQEGRLYLDGFVFGGTAPWGHYDDAAENLHIDGHASFIANPVHLFPSWDALFHSPLCAVIAESVSKHAQHELNTPNEPDGGLWALCSIGEETVYKGTKIRTTKYRFVDTVATRIYPMKQYGRESYTIDFRTCI